MNLDRTLRLPPEVLAHVFMFSARYDPPCRISTRRAWDRRLRLGWIGVTHVCSRWRQIALAFPALWSRVDFVVGETWANEMFARSKMAPVIVSSMPITGHEFTARDARSISLHLSHIRRVCINAQCNGDFFHWLGSPAPMLNSIDVVAMQTRGYSPPILPASMFNHYAPHLQQLHLEGFCRFPWTSPVLTNIVVLELIDTPYSSQNEALDALARMLAIQSLALCRSFAPAARVVRARRLGLPSLRRLRLEGDVVDCIRLLKYLSLPSMAEIHLLCTAGEEGRDARGLFPVLGTHLEQSTVLHELTYDATSPALQVEVARYPPLPSKRADVTVKLVWDANPTVVTSFIQTSWYYLSPHCVRSVRLNIYPDPPAKRVLEIFGAMRGVERLVADRSISAVICVALATRIDGQDFFCPHLSWLALHDVPLEVLEMLHRVLHIRKGGGTELAELHIYVDLPSRKSVDSLRRIVPVVEWHLSEW
ncbi:hypothetical protein BV25DRAFT_495662 [Artomyces pyxidatus]|uniref:Uncharacterized protein n=1 Tax=Artomyces pyxidatus TaxID=48021 RepID=A0ACB8T4F8_9AGAM|nr:hypothetical protein BV25DRAFT_495662 [Artomyces pyxidatus]